MSRVAFLEYATAYVNTITGVYADSTCSVLLRRYKDQSRTVQELYKEKLIKTTSPKSMSADDVKQFISRRRSREGISPGEISHDVTAIKSLFAFVDNPAVEMCLRKYPGLKPRGGTRRLPSMDECTLDKIYRRAATIDPSNWKLVRAYTLVVLAIDTGVRSKEARLMNVSDIDRSGEDWIVNIIHVKGEDSYGMRRRTFVTGILRKLLEEYLPLREEFVKENGIESDALFPSPSKSSKKGYMASNSIRMIKNVVEQDLGIIFDLRKCRRTFGQQLLNQGLDIESTSVLMGHTSTQTTEGFYARKDLDSAMLGSKEVRSRKVRSY